MKFKFNASLLSVIFLLLSIFTINAQVKSLNGKILSPAPPMGWLTWNLFADKVNEKDIREIADIMTANGMVKAGYNLILIDDGWQGGRDNRNNIIADPQKFPSGIKALADYLHSRNMKLGIYSDASPLTCERYTASLNFEEQDAKTFASWGIDYLKYDYCNAPPDAITAQVRYKAMADALRKSKRDIEFSVCEWGDRKPWFWAGNIGGQLWRTTADIRDKWVNTDTPRKGWGIIDVYDVNVELYPFAGIGYWNDPDALMIGLYGKKGPSGALGGVGCNDTQYQSQFSLWAMMNAPLLASNDIRNMNEATKAILLNEEVIAVAQDSLGKQAERKIKGNVWDVLTKPLANGDTAVAILNRSDKPGSFQLKFCDFGLCDSYEIRDLWQHKSAGKGKNWQGTIAAYETKVFRLKKV